MGSQISFEGIHNVRDLGGIPVAGGARVREGLLFRSDQLFPATEADIALLASLGIGAVFDFRSVPEREEKPDPEIPGARNVFLPVIEDVRTGITRGGEGDARMVDLVMSGEVSDAFVDAHMQGMYRRFVADPFSHAQYARFVDGVIGEACRGRAALWHCTAGKDRAGFATVVILEALGVDRSDIVADYLQTNECLAKTVDQIVAMASGMISGTCAVDVLRRFFLADESYLGAAYAAIDEQFGSVDAFLGQALGIDQDKREAMQALFLVHPGTFADNGSGIG